MTVNDNPLVILLEIHHIPCLTRVVAFFFDAFLPQGRPAKRRKLKFGKSILGKHISTIKQLKLKFENQNFESQKLEIHNLATLLAD